MTTLPTIPTNEIIEYQRTIPYSALSVQQTSFRALIVGLPKSYVVCGTSIKVLTAFSGPSLSSLTCSLGAFVPNSILSDLFYYGGDTELTQVVTPQSYSLSGPPLNNLTSGLSYASATGLYFNGPHDVAGYFTSTGTTLDTLTAGVVEITVQIRKL